MSIDISNYRTWKSDEVTIALFRSLKDIRVDIEKALLDSVLILEPNSDKKLAKLVGMRDALDLVLEMTFEDIKVDGEDVDDQESVETSRA